MQYKSVWLATTGWMVKRKELPKDRIKCVWQRKEDKGVARNVASNDLARNVASNDFALNAKTNVRKLIRSTNANDRPIQRKLCQQMEMMK